MYDVLPTNLSKIIHGIKYISFACTNLSSSDNRIRLYVDQMKYQLLSVNFFQSKTYLFTDWLVEHPSTNISMDHRSFGHHWRAKTYTYK
jgi:hypothetical protein